MKPNMNLSTSLNLTTPLIAPRFGTPGAAALFVGSDLRNDYFIFPLSQIAVVSSERGQRLLTQFEETPHDAAMYDFAYNLYDIALEGTPHV